MSVWVNRTVAMVVMAAFAFGAALANDLAAVPAVVPLTPQDRASVLQADATDHLMQLPRATPSSESSRAPRLPLALRANLAASNARACIGDSCIYATVAAAFEQVMDNETITILPGLHREGVILRANGVTIRGEPGAHLHGTAAQGKAAIVIKGRDTVIEDLECSGITVKDRNGACIRLEAPNLTLRRVHFHDSEMGILTGNKSGEVLVEDSVIENNGKNGRGYSHNVYVGSGTLIIRNSTIIRPNDQGHSIKSRAAKTVVEGSVVGSLDHVDSRAIDIPNGGEIVLRDNVIHEGPNSVNSDVIGIGLGIRNGKKSHEFNHSTIENNIIISDRKGATAYVHYRDVPPPVMRNNIIVGKTNPRMDGNTWFENRREADLPPYPDLPTPPSMNAMK